MVYVLDINGTQLMPTKRHGKVRRLLRDNLAKVIQLEPFTIQLLYEPKTKIVDRINLGVDASNSVIGLVAATETETLFAAEVELRKDVSTLIKRRKELRGRRRYRNKKRVSKINTKREVHNKKPQLRSRMSPTTEQKVQSHLSMIKKVNDILPIETIIIETNQFDDKDVHMISDNHELNPFKVREFVLARDGHKCVLCGHNNKKLSISHIINNEHEIGRFYSDAVNYYTYCDSCNTKFMNNKLPKDYEKQITNNNIPDKDVKQGRMRFKVYSEAKKLYKNVKQCFGYKIREIRNNRNEKYSPINNALIMTGYNPEKPDFCYKYKLRRNHNRSLGRVTPTKNGVYYNKKVPYFTKGFSSYDKVKYNGKKYYITKKRKSGYFGLGTYDGRTLINSVKYDKLKLIQKRKSYSVERVYLY